ncbi:THAP domain-containing protein 1 [Plakobranchus ocellatus]|uniref:THAP domain-containing protein 1 n=1 Tax=Plakobranchus ocellatus TaxID=259542 RepID=A0AAV4AGL6_9GAST|nr:THAP domain-containing protein 1 [Plakobranchus ocellatus]
MVSYCCIYTCVHRSRPSRDRPGINKEILFHPFPRKDLKKLKEWLSVVRPFVRNADAWRITRWVKICSDHFLPSDYMNMGRKVLKKDAVPSVFTGCKPIKSLGLTETYQNANVSPCAALGCPSKFTYCGDILKPSDEGRSFYCFPLTRPDILEKWEVAVGRKGYKATHTQRLCSRHFTRDSFIGKGRLTKHFQKLRPDAVPTLFTLPPLDLLDQVEPSAPYLQPKVVLYKVDELDFEPPKQFTAPAGTCQHIPFKALTCDHTYHKAKADTVEEMNRLGLVIEALKNQVMTSSHRVKSLKLSVTALKRQYELEMELLNNDLQGR